MRAATAAVRDELVQVRAGRACDRRAELAGLLRSSGSFHVLGAGNYALEASSEHPGVARRIYEALQQALGMRGSVFLLEPGRGHPKKRYMVRAEGLSLQRLVEAGILDERGVPGRGVPRRLVAKRCCAAAYLRGAFLARGSVSDPRRAAHLEVRASDERDAADLAAVLTHVGAPSRTRAHRGWAAYCKGTVGIGAALAAMGAHDAYLAWEAGSVWKTVHVEAARLANADTANARRLARAAVTQLKAIDELEQTHGLRALPGALREVAELRRAYPDASLEELGRFCGITKAAAADRIRRLVRMAGSP